MLAAILAVSRIADPNLKSPEWTEKPSEQMKEHFRWRTIIALFVEPITGSLGLAFFLAVFACVILKLVAHIFQTPFLKYEYYTNLILFLPLLILPVYHRGAILRNLSTSSFCWLSPFTVQ